jgi:hypothetical protein
MLLLRFIFRVMLLIALSLTVAALAALAAPLSFF